MIARTLAAAVAVLALAACSSSAPPKPAAHAVSASPAATTPAGCHEALLTTGTIRTQLESGQPDIHAAVTQFRALARSVADPTLKLDIDRANVDLAFFAERVAAGQDGGRYAKGFAADLKTISSYCGR